MLYAIVRVDYVGFANDGYGTPIPYRDRISVPKIVDDVDVANAEVARLNTLNGRKGAQYFWVNTRIKEPGIVERLKIHSLYPKVRK